MADLLFHDKPLIGLDIGQTGIKVMAIDEKKWLVNGYGSIELDPAKMQSSLEGNNDEYFANSLKELLTKNLIGDLPSNHVVIGVPTARTFSRTFTVPVKVESHLKDAVEVEVDQYIPIPLSLLYVDYEIIERSKDNLTVMLSAVPKLLVDSCIKAAKAAGLRPILVEPSINSVARVIYRAEEGHLPTVIVDIGAAATDVAVLDKTIRVSGSIGVGGNTLTLDIAKKLNIELENAHQIKVLNGLSAGPRQDKILTALKPTLQRITTETRKVMRYYNERISDDRKIEQLLIVGAGSNVPGIGEYFTNELMIAARVASPWQRLNFGKLEQPNKQLRPRYITVSGLASIDEKRAVS